MKFPDTPEGRARAARAEVWEIEGKRQHEEWRQKHLCPCGSGKLREQPTFIRELDSVGTMICSRLVYVKCDHKGATREWEESNRPSENFWTRSIESNSGAKNGQK